MLPGGEIHLAEPSKAPRAGQKGSGNGLLPLKAAPGPREVPSA